MIRVEEAIQDSTVVITSNDVQKIEGVKKEEASDFVLVPSSIKQEEVTQVTSSNIIATTDTDSNTNTNTTTPTNTTTTATLDSNAKTTNATTPNNQLAINTEELKAEILRQVEYYFSSKNLVRDKFLQQQIAKDPDHFVPISVLITFNKLKALSTDIDFIADVLKSSKSLILSDDGKSVKTPIDVPLLSFPKPSVTICDKTFSSQADMWIFYNSLLLKYKQGENLDEKDFNYLKDLIKFHEKAVEKIGVGVESIRVGVAVGFDEPSICFILKRKDGTEDNFSYNKCIQNIFESPHQNKKGQNKKNNQGENQNKKRQRNEKQDEKQDEKLDYTPSCLLKIEADQNQEKSTSKPAETVESSDKMETSSAETKNEQPQLQTQAEKVETSNKAETDTATTNEQLNDDKTDKNTTTQQPKDDNKGALAQTNSQLDTSNTKLNGKTLKDYFSKYGQVRWVDVREKRLVYVRFNNQESAKNALSDDGKIVGPASKISLVTGDEEKIWYRQNALPRNNNSKFKRGGPHKKFKKY